MDAVEPTLATSGLLAMKELASSLVLKIPN